MNYLYNEFESIQVSGALSEMGFECLKHVFEGKI